ncbi:MAG: hypothetical protein JNL10_13925 [Verrucomicrobiales bacterium]|nr:hypothetical protein [Verrucomicrobiales bacterium]
MAGALLQGAPGATLDTDLWIDLPSRQYMRVMNLCRGLGARLLAATVAVLPDDTEVNFVYSPDGLRPFRIEYPRALRLRLQKGFFLKVLPIERILASKLAAGRPKDLAVIPLLRQVIRSRRLGAVGKGAGSQNRSPRR